jgi:hypothetical protein
MTASRSSASLSAGLNSPALPAKGREGLFKGFLADCSVAGLEAGFEGLEAFF